MFERAGDWLLAHRKRGWMLLAVPALAVTAYTVHPGDSLSAIAAKDCGSAAAWPHLYAANRSLIGADPNLILPGQHFKVSTAACRFKVTALTAPMATTPLQPTSVSTVGLSGFEQCVISRESGGNPRAQNPTSTASGLYQFLLTSWYAIGYGAAYPGGAKTAPVSVQQQAFHKAYALYGVSWWRPYDGCLKDWI
jgi:LysM repeat protein